MRAFHLLWLMLVLLTGGCTEEHRPPAPPAMEGAPILDFETGTEGALPPGFSVKRTGGETRWEIVATDGALSGRHVFAQTKPIPDEKSPSSALALLGGFVSPDVDVTVHLRPVSGAVDHAAGLVWGYIDRDNYYVVRANARTGDVIVCRVADGKWTDLEVEGAWYGNGVKAAVPADTWSELRVIARGSLITVYLNGRELFRVVDSTFREAGEIGLWTKAGSVTWFDDLRFSG